ncbi:MAG TPA: hypothetical protein VGA42_03305 [Gemmatimonadales bacterium]
MRVALTLALAFVADGRWSLDVGRWQSATATHVLLVTGVGGEPGYSAAFAEQAQKLITGLERYGVPRDRIVWLAEDAAKAPGRIAGRSTRERVLAELTRIGSAAQAEDRVLVVLIGHGSDGDEPRFNVPGPDLSARDLVAVLKPLEAPLVAVVNAASASGGFVEPLAGPRRIVITATRTGFERNETRFVRSFAAAFEGDAADGDKDGAVSLLEAFTFATRDVSRWYQSENRLLTEHARVSDEDLARQFVLTPAARVVTAAPGDSVTAALLARKRELEGSIERLRGRKAAMDSTMYARELEALLLELARTNQALRARGGRTP